MVRGPKIRGVLHHERERKMHQRHASLFGQHSKMIGTRMRPQAGTASIRCSMRALFGLSTATRPPTGSRSDTVAVIRRTESARVVGTIM